MTFLGIIQIAYSVNDKGVFLFLSLRKCRVGLCSNWVKLLRLYHCNIIAL